MEGLHATSSSLPHLFSLILAHTLSFIVGLRDGRTKANFKMFTSKCKVKSF